MLRTTLNKVNPQLISNEEKKLYDELITSLEECQSFIFNVAFISFGGLQLFINSFNELRDKGVSGKILTSTYLNFTSPKALLKIMEYDNIELRIHDDQSRGLHSKSYILEEHQMYPLEIDADSIHGVTVTIYYEKMTPVMIFEQNIPTAQVVKEYYEKSRQFTRKEIEKDFNITERQARTILEKLLEDNQISKRGSGPRTFYVINE